MNATHILRTYLHVADDGAAAALPVTDAFWPDVAAGAYPQLEHGRLMSAFEFSQPWTSWERHPHGEELVMLLAGRATLILQESGGERAVELSEPGAFVLVPRNTWHTADTGEPTTMLFLTPGAGTEHRAR